MVPFFRTPYNYDMAEVSEMTGLSCPEVSLTVQDAAEEADINTIVRRFGLTGELPDAVKAPVYADFEEVVDFHSAMLAVRQAEAAFMRMPAEVRARFGNDAGAFVDFCSDNKNLAELQKLGLTRPDLVIPDVPPVPVDGGEKA